VERFRRLAADDADMALVAFEPHRARHVLLALVYRRLQHLALGRIPESVIDQLGIARPDLVLEVGGPAVERDALDAAMRPVEDRAARCLVDAARLHADE